VHKSILGKQVASQDQGDSSSKY